MLNSLQNPLSLAGRMLLALLFVPAGFSKITGFAGTVGYIGSAGLPLPSAAAIVAIIVEIGAGLALVVGFGTRIAALALAFFTLVATFFFHAFWSVPADQQMIQELFFFKNFAIVGGLLLLVAFGPGAWSVDQRRA